MNGQSYNLSYDAENRLVSVTSTNMNASFVYDGDGRRVKSIIKGVTTTFVGIHYEISGGTVTKYYYAGNSRIAMRTGSTLTYLLTDHLGSTSMTTSSTGSLISELRYKPWGEVRYSSGTTSTSYTFTGQYSNVSDFGLLFYNARFYDPQLGRFSSADTLIGFDRYQYANNNPIRFIDPSGHTACQGSNWDDGPQCINDPDSNWKTNIEIARQDWLFSRAFKGTGKNDSWTSQDWRTYLNNRDFYWDNPDKWINPDPKGIDGWVAHVDRLASYYSVSEKEEFIRDFALLFGGIPYYTSAPSAARSVSGGPELPILNESPKGLDPVYQEGKSNQSHHYAGLFFVGYYTSEIGGLIVDYVRDGNAISGINPPDMYIGSVAAQNGWDFRNNLTPSDMANLISQLSSYGGWVHWQTSPMYVNP